MINPGVVDALNFCYFLLVATLESAQTVAGANDGGMSKPLVGTIAAELYTPGDYYFPCMQRLLRA